MYRIRRLPTTVTLYMNLERRNETGVLLWTRLRFLYAG
jgi:hypothetical protein